jgi:erythromycin esterase-like protein
VSSLFNAATKKKRQQQQQPSSPRSATSPQRGEPEEVFDTLPPWFETQPQAPLPQPQETTPPQPSPLQQRRLANRRAQAEERRRQRAEKQQLQQQQRFNSASQYRTLEDGETYSSAMPDAVSASIALEPEPELFTFTAEDLPVETADWQKALIYSEILQRKY